MTTSGLSILRTIIDGSPEPVSLDELKTHCAIDFEDHDTLLFILLTAAREEVEEYTGLSLIKKSITARWETLTTAELPYGPVTAIVDADDYTVKGLIGAFVSIEANSETPTEISYTAGYESCPEGLRLAIMKKATDDFTGRFPDLKDRVDVSALPLGWKKSAARYSRKSWLN